MVTGGSDKTRRFPLQRSHPDGNAAGRRRIPRPGRPGRATGEPADGQRGLPPKLPKWS
jgi:hypothetical protein